MFLKMFSVFIWGSLSRTSGLRAQEEVTFVGNEGILYSHGTSILALLVNIQVKFGALTRFCCILSMQ